MSELKKKTEQELMKMLAEKRELVRSFRFDTTGTRIKNVKEGSQTKKLIAQILTELHMRQNNA